MLVTDVAEVAAIAQAIADAPVAAFDLEFVSADRLVPKLALIQVAWVAGHVALDAPAAALVAAPVEIRLVDPLAVDAAPVARALAGHRCVVAHAPRQDLALLAVKYGTEMPGMMDTQLMAAFCGLGEQIGLSALVGELVGRTLGKEQQFTAWDRRPLSSAQVAYAADDVRYLIELYGRLAERLGPRVAWAREESAQVHDDALAAARVTEATAWREVGGTRGLDAAAQAAVIALAAWRWRVANELDRPLGHVLPDKLIVELARVRPSDPGGVRAVRGLPPLAKTRADDVIAALAAAPAAEARPRASWRAPSERAGRWADMLLVIARLVAAESGIAARLLATRADAEELSRVVDERGLAAAGALPAMATWRREVLGARWQGFLEGSLALVGDTAAEAGVRLVARDS